MLRNTLRVGHSCKRKSRTMTRLVLLLFLFYACESEKIYMDHYCGANIENAARITCQYIKPGIYTSRKTYGNVVVIEFTRDITQSVLCLDTFPNVTDVIIPDISVENGCQYIESSSFHSVILFSGSANWTCNVSELTSAVTSSTSSETAVTSSTSSKTAVTSSTSSKTAVTSSTSSKTAVTSSTSSKTAVTSSTSSKTAVTSSTSSKTAVTSSTSSKTAVTSSTSRKTAVTSSTSSKTAVTSSTSKTAHAEQQASTTAEKQLTTSSSSLPSQLTDAIFGTGAGALLCVIIAIILAICLKCKLIELKKLTMGNVGVEFECSRRHILDETELSSVNVSATRSSIEEPIEHHTLGHQELSSPQKPVSSGARSPRRHILDETELSSINVSSILGETELSSINVSPTGSSREEPIELHTYGHQEMSSPEKPVSSRTRSQVKC